MQCGAKLHVSFILDVCYLCVCMHADRANKRFFTRARPGTPLTTQFLTVTLN